MGAQPAVGILHDLKEDVGRAASREDDGEGAGIAEREDDRLGAVGLARGTVAGAGVRKGELRCDRWRKIALFVGDQAEVKRHAFADAAHRHLDAECELIARDQGAGDQKRLIALGPRDDRRVARCGRKRR